ncbi:MAG: hypothetical protein J6S14_13095 [Clostridia bacterium]|nr:hypothetical protein [Clostridia bacterium]
MPNVIIMDDMHKRNPYNEKNGIAAAFSCPVKGGCYWRFYLVIHLYSKGRNAQKQDFAKTFFMLHFWRFVLHFVLHELFFMGFSVVFRVRHFSFWVYPKNLETPVNTAKTSKRPVFTGLSVLVPVKGLEPLRQTSNRLCLLAL